ncbi:glycosyltransferase family 4 protein [Candidatus Bipolaricaulota bacterium]
MTQHYRPETAATGQLLTDLSTGLAREGFRVTVYAAQPSYGTRVRQPRREVRDDVHIRRVFSTRLGRHRAVFRLADAGTFCVSLIFRLLFMRRMPLLIVSNPPFLMWVGWMLSLLRGYPYTLLIHDVYPDVAIRLGVVAENGVAVQLWRWLNEKAYRRSKRIITLGERMEERLAQHRGVAQEKMRVIHNWADSCFIRPLPKCENPFVQEQGLSGKLVVLYSGNMGRSHDLETLVEAANRLRDNREILFLFIGDGAKKGKLVDRARELDLPNVRFLPYQPVDRLPYTIPTGDIGVVTLEQGTEGLSVPSKLYTYLAAGSAVLALLGEGSEVADIVEQFDCGVRVTQGDVEGVVRSLERWCEDRCLLDGQKANARECLMEMFTRQRAIKQYVELLEDLGDS